MFKSISLKPGMYDIVGNPMIIISPTILNRNWESKYFFVKIDENSVPELIVLVLRVICSIGSLSFNDID